MQYMVNYAEKAVFLPVLPLFWSKSVACEGFVMFVLIMTKK